LRSAAVTTRSARDGVASADGWLWQTMSPAAFAQSGYHQLKKIGVPGDGFWDYYLIADGATGRV